MKRLVLAGCLLVSSVGAFASAHDPGSSPLDAQQAQPSGKPSQTMPVEQPRVTGAANECVDATVMSSYSPQLQFGLDGQHYALPAFAAEVVRPAAAESTRKHRRR